MTCENARDRCCAENYGRTVKLCKLKTVLYIYRCNTFLVFFFGIRREFDFASFFVRDTDFAFFLRIVQRFEFDLSVLNDCIKFGSSLTSHYSTTNHTYYAGYNKNFRAMLLDLEDTLIESSRYTVKQFCLSHD